MLNEIESSVVAVLEIKGIDAKQRFIELMTAQREVAIRSEIVIEYFSTSRNKNLHFELERLAHEILVPATKKIIEQGIDEGIFDTKYPLECAYMINMMIHKAMDSIKGENVEVEKVKKSIEVTQYFTERVLGMKTGSFDVYQKFLSDSYPELDRMINEKRVRKSHL